jgi:TP53 regulating kinase-like protein
MILDKQGKVRFIDFGLSFVSEKIEDKAVDLHLFREALESKHFRHEKEIWKEFVKGYAPKEKTQILKRLELVELRGRNKQKF